MPAEIVSDDKCHKAVAYLAETDQPAALARARMDALNASEKTILALEILEAEGTAQERESRARVSTAYREWKSEYEDALADWYLYQNKRSTAEKLVEVWRSVNASRRTGNI